MQLPSVAIKVSGNDGVKGSEWERNVTLHQPSLTGADSMRLLADVESVCSLLISGWLPMLRQFNKAMSEKAAQKRMDEIRMESGG